MSFETRQKKAERMADLMVELIRDGRNEVTEGDLLECGFTPDELRECWPMARGLAGVKLGREI